MAEQKYSEKFEKIFSFTRSISNVLGCDVIKEHYKICLRTVFVFILVNLSIGLTFYTLYSEVIVKGNYYNLLKASSVLGTAIQGYTKLVNVIKQRNNFCYLYKEIYEMYRTYEMKSSSYKRCLSYNITLVKKLLVTLFTIISIITLIVIAVPTFILVVFKEHIEILPFQLPFLDNESNFGYYSTYGIQIVCVIFGGFGNFVIDSWLFIYVSHIPLIKSILKCKFDDLNIILEENPKDIEKSRNPLNDIFKWHQKYIDFSDTIKNTFYWVIFVQITTEFFGIVCTIVCIFLGIWPPAPAYLFYLITLIYSYCSLGNLVELANEDVTDMIYDCCWYNLTVPEQKMILIMLRESQQATGISIGGIAPLSLNTALQLTKTVYTLSMMLKNFLD